jgi:hypothetical protein
MRWTFGAEPLEQSLTFAKWVRDVAGLVLSLESPHPAVERLSELLRGASDELAGSVPGDPRPRVGPRAQSDGRVYLDHSRDIGAFNPCFPTYEIRVEGDRAGGTVAFPVVYEGPPGVVHGGFLAVFFDSVVQHHNCELGVAGKTTSLALAYRRPTPILDELRFEVERSARERRIESVARLYAGDGVVHCQAQVSAVSGSPGDLPPVSPRRLET